MRVYRPFVQRDRVARARMRNRGTCQVHRVQGGREFGRFIEKRGFSQIRRSTRLQCLSVN